MKKLGILFAVLVMSVMFAVSASALEPTGQCGDNVYWEYDETTGELVISGEGAMMNYSGSNSPFYDSNIKSVVVESDVTTIGERAFYNCDNLTSVAIPDSVTTIGHYAFVDTGYYNNSSNWENSVLYIGKYLIKAKNSLSGSYKIKDGTRLIADYAFKSCDNLTSVAIPENVTTIGDQAFCDCDSLISVTISDSVTTIGDKAFCYCDNLEIIMVDADNTAYSSDSRGALFDKNKTVLIQYPIGSTNSSYIILDGVTTIGKYAFAYCDSLTSITIPNSVTTIGDQAFFSCDNLKSVAIGDSVTTIGYGAFSCCDGLTSITVDDDNTVYSSDNRGVLFDKNKMVLIQYPVGNTNSSYMIPDSVTTIGAYAFDNCSRLTNVTIYDSVTTIGEFAFYTCDRLKKVYYMGFKEQWQKMEFNLGNDCLFDAAIYYHDGKHSYKAVVTDPTCTAQGYTTFTCECGDTYKANYVDKLNHKDDNGDYKCDYNCGYEFEKPAPEVPEVPEEELNFFEKIVQWFKDLFDKLFGWMK